MTRRRKTPIDVADTIFLPVKRLEIYRRALNYMRARREVRVAAGSGKAELKTIDGDIAAFAGIIALCEIYPLDTPQPEPEPELPEQPLCMPGCEEWMADFLAEAVGDTP